MTVTRGSGTCTWSPRCRALMVLIKTAQTCPQNEGTFFMWSTGSAKHQCPDRKLLFIEYNCFSNDNSLSFMSFCLWCLANRRWLASKKASAHASLPCSWLLFPSTIKTRKACEIKYSFRAQQAKPQPTQWMTSAYKKVLVVNTPFWLLSVSSVVCRHTVRACYKTTTPAILFLSNSLPHFP